MPRRRPKIATTDFETVTIPCVARTAILLVGLLAVPSISPAQEASKPDPLSQESYLVPSREIADAVLAPWWKNVTPGNFAPDGNAYLVLERSGLPRLADLGRPHANLGGLDVDTGANRSRTLSVRGSTGIRIVSVTGESVSIPVPAGLRVSDPTWSPDQRHVAYFLHRPDRSEVWVYTLATKANRRIAADAALATLNADLKWLDADTVVAVLVPKERPVVPADAAVATAPRVGVTESRRFSLRTYASLLGGPGDAARFEHFATGQLALLDLDGKVTPVGKPMMVSRVTPSPDGKFLWVATVERPFSYLFPYSNFGQREVILDLQGEVKTEIRKRGLSTGGDGTPGGGGNSDPRRGLEWRPDGRGLSFIRSAGGGEGAPRGDRVMLWKAPFGPNDTEEVWSSDQRISSVRYSADAKTLFVTLGGAAGPARPGATRPAPGGAASTERTRLVAVRPGSAAAPATILESRPDDDPATLVTFTTPMGASAVRVSKDGASAYLQGTEYAKDPFAEAPRPWLDRVAVADGKRTRVWQSKADVYETASVLDDDLNAVLVSRQSPAQIPNYFLANLATSKERKLTDNQDYLPDLTQARRERFQVTRNDGVKFWVTVTYPRYYTFGKLPAFFWFYPSEFTDQAAYDRTKRTFNKNDFTEISPSNKAIFIRRGYLLVEPDCPIIGPNERKNDAYIPQLRNNLAATIDELDRRGVIDRTRLAIGGHSYGAFSTVNAMVHTPFFRAGIAGDGNYNRSLTPFGFQSDQRLLWEARETYLSMSPILYAEQMTGALLMYHGMEDQNVGTDPINSERLFATLQALGKPAALYMYPYEDHGQIAQETILDQWARWTAWLDKHLGKG
jgi:dipeptidyl aminopeptidase/acylaminoacyl peptidase